MSKLNILQAITNGIWLIQPEFAEASAGLIARILNGEEAIRSYNDDNDEEVNFKGSFSISSQGAISYGNKYNPFDGAMPGSTAVIGMSGPIMKYDNCGDPGTKTYSEVLNKAIQNPNINSIVLVMDSPGGTVDGTMDLATLVKNSTKPVVCFVDGLMASAGYWIGSGASEIIANNETATIGSIGTMISFADMQAMWEKEGVKFHYITADASVDKNKDFIEARKGNYDLLKAKLNSINDLFLASVKENRTDKLNIQKENVLTGKNYLASEALSNGLIDAINTFEYAVQRAQSLAIGDTTKPESQVNNQVKNQTQNNMKKITLLATHAAFLALCGATIEAGKDSVDIEMTDDLLAKIEDQLTAGSIAQSSLQTANESLTTANALVESKDKEITGLKADNKILSAKVSLLDKGTSASAVKEGDDKLEAGEKENYVSEVDKKLAEQRAANSTEFK